MFVRHFDKNKTAQFVRFYFIKEFEFLPDDILRCFIEEMRFTHIECEILCLSR